MPVSIAAISLSKLALFLAVVGLLLRSRPANAVPYRWEDTTVVLVLCMLAALALSMAYSDAPWNLASIDLVKYSKLLLIVVVPFLIRTREQALTGLALFAVVQLFILLSSWALALGISLPWVTSPVLIQSNSVFHEYLHQSIMTTGFAALCWHLRRELKAPWFRILAPALCMLALINVLFLLKGRSAYIAAVTVIVAAVIWETRQQWRWLAVLAPVLVVTLALITAPQFKARSDLVVAEALAFKPGNESPSSTGARLNFWYRSAQAIAERPLTGFGAGSWGEQYRRLDAGADPWYKNSGGNPHQEFLMWGVLLGVGGMGLIFALLVTLWRDASKLAPPHARAMKSMILILASTGLFNCVLYDGRIGDYFCLMLGLLLALGRAPAADRFATQVGSKALA